MNISILEGNLDRAKEMGNKVLSNMNFGYVENSQMGNYTNNTNFQFYQTDSNNNQTQFYFLNEHLNI